MDGSQQNSPQRQPAAQRAQRVPEAAQAQRLFNGRRNARVAVAGQLDQTLLLLLGQQLLGSRSFPLLAMLPLCMLRAELLSSCCTIGPCLGHPLGQA